MSYVADHPELADGPNPFFDGISPFIPFNELPIKLSHFPLDGVDWRAVPTTHREPLLDLTDRHFAPTTAVIEPASGIQSLLRRTLVLANPLRPSNHKMCNQIGMIESVDGLEMLAPAQGGGMLLSGMTATGKSTLIKHALETFAPQQVLDHGNSEAGGFYGLRQCVYLLVDHPSNGTRTALLKRILQCLDSKVHTNYYEAHRKVSNLDSLLVTVSKLLTRHRVAILCIDEKQESTFEDNPWRRQFSLFYLQLMNLGISVVLAGNPLAFKHLAGYSQLMRRFSTGGVHSLLPATPFRDSWWTRDFVRHARAFSIVEKWSIDEQRRSHFENENSAGLPGLFMAYHQEVQRSALRRGGSCAEVSDQDYLAAQTSPRFKQLRRIALAAASEEARLSSQFIDIPPLTKPIKAIAKPVIHSSADAMTTATPKAAITAAEKLVRSFKAQQTRQTNQVSKSLKELSMLPAEDVRRLGVSEELISEMTEQLEALKPVEKKKPARAK